MTRRTASGPDRMSRTDALTSVPILDGPPDDVGAAVEAVERLVCSARGLVATDAAVLAAVPDAPALASELAALPVAAPAVPALAGEGAEAFLAALAAAGTAVYACRRFRHPGHECLFGDAAGHLCQRVLLAAHRLGDRTAV